MAPLLSTLWQSSFRIRWQPDLQSAIQDYRAERTVSHIAQDAAARTSSEDGASYRGGPQIAGIDLVAMLVSDSGLASTDPVWWNTSPMGCLLIGMQPRGGWQVMQRTVQWGQDHITRAFGVNCTTPEIYSYFACSIRNRLEVWDSPRWNSPMQNEAASAGWANTRHYTISRPTKLIDGSRGGQAFICELLRPRDGEHYGIEQQARMQFLSVLLTAAGLLEDKSINEIKNALRDDLGITDRLSLIFRRLLVGVLVANTILFLALAAICNHFWRRNILGRTTSYVVELTSIASWAIGAIGLLMQGGNPRVCLKPTPLPPHIEARCQQLLDKANEMQHEQESAPVPSITTAKIGDNNAITIEKVDTEASPGMSYSAPCKVRFGSLHGSIFVEDKGHCYLPMDVVRTICEWDLQLQRPWQWYFSVAWFGSLLIVSMALQIVGTKVSTTGSVVLGVVILLSTSVMRGSGISGPEEWQIPQWKRRKGTTYGAALQGALSSR